jgi:hypothetical protein
MKIAIAGTRGIPNYYSGFEHWPEYLSRDLVTMGHEVYVYNSHNHVYQEKTWHGVTSSPVRPRVQVGTFGQFIYDYNCIRDSRRRDFDVILLLGLHEQFGVGAGCCPKRPVIISNMDGLEWKRSKYSRPVQAVSEGGRKVAVQPATTWWPTRWAFRLPQNKYHVRGHVHSVRGAPSPARRDGAGGV